MSLSRWELGLIVKTIDQLMFQISEKFIQGMVDRMFTSYYKYGDIKNNFPHNRDALESLMLRLKKYQETGNTEWLMDVANYAMIEFMLPKHPNAHFKATDSTESPGVVRNDGTVALGKDKFEYKREGD